MKDILDTRKMRPLLGQTAEIMRCPKCGARIPEGNLYCEACGEEIRFVPEFEPEVDDSISSAMNGVAGEIAAENARAAMGGGDAEGDAYIDLHIRIPRRALRYAVIGLCAAAAVALAVLAVPRILRLEVFDRASRAREEAQEASQSLSAPDGQPEAADAPEQAEEPVEAAGVEAPVLDYSSGRYEGEVAVSIENRVPENRYYYTTDGTAPDEGAERCLGPILIGEGETTLRVIAVGADGTASEETIAVYTVSPAGPAAPVILEDSGEYTQSTMIVVVSQEDCTITYTTDGSEPEIDSAVYTAPIKMPVGNSVFRFRAFDGEGVGSETVERVYHLAYARLVSEEQAVDSVLRILVDKNVLIDMTGKVLGADGHNTYQVESTIEIEGAGEYYRIVERYVTGGGSAEETGLLYAVNTNDGSVHRLGYDSSGNYTLFTLSAHQGH